MAEETPSGDAAAALDEEAKRLALEEAKAKSRQAIAEARAGMLSALVPTPEEGAPTGKTTLADKAGAYGPWLVHLCVDAAARDIAEAARESLGGVTNPRVLVVEKRAFLASDFVSREVTDTLAMLSARLGELTKALRADTEQPAHEQPPARPPLGTWNAPGLEVAEREARARTAPGEPAVAADAVSAATGALPAALGLLNLLRADYDVAPSDVTTTTGELATLTAAYLAHHPTDSGPGAGNTDEKPRGNQQSHAALAVLLDDFVTVDPASATLAAYRAAVDAHTNCAAQLRTLQIRLAQVESESKILATRVVPVLDAWKAAVTAEKSKEVEGRETALSAELDERTHDLVRLDSEAAALKALVSAASDQIAAADNALAALVDAPESGPAPLLAAITRERLRSSGKDGGPITHVVYVQLDGAGADSQTRRLVLGESGRLGFMGSVSSSWLLMEVETGRLSAGGQCPVAKMLVYDLATGDAKVKAVSPDGQGPQGKDPALSYEIWAKSFIAVVAFFLIAVAAMGIVNLANGS